MRRGRLPLTALRAFEAAGRVESISLAAAELCVSQAAVSRQIKELEQGIGVALFQRVHRGVRLTPEGYRLLRGLTQAFDGIDDALGEIRVPTDETISISADPSVAACWLASSLLDFHRLVPEADVVLSSDPRVVDFGDEGTTLAIRYSRERSSWPRTEVRKLHDIHLSAYLSPALADSAGIRTPADLLRLPRLHEDSRDDWQAWLVAARVEPPANERGVLFNESATMIQAALGGQGIALTDELLTQHALASGTLIRPFEIFIPGGAYWLVSRGFNRLPDGARKFSDWLMNAVATGG